METVFDLNQQLVPPYKRNVTNLTLNT